MDAAPSLDPILIATALGAGMLSFASPCVLPLVPVYLGYMSGAAVQKGRVQASRCLFAR